jgi:hypothetical protein
LFYYAIFPGSCHEASHLVSRWWVEYRLSFWDVMLQCGQTPQWNIEGGVVWRVSPYLNIKYLFYRFGEKKSFFFFFFPTPILQEEFENTKGTIRIRISKKNRQHNGQKKKHKRTNNNLQNIHIKLKIELHEPH